MRTFTHIPILGLASLLAACGTTIHPGSRGIKNIVLNEPALEAQSRPEGFYWQWPWNNIIAYDVTLQTADETVEVLTADDLHVPTTVSVTYRPRPMDLHMLHTEIGPDYYEDVIKPPFVTLVRSEFAKHKHNDLARHGPQIETAVLAELRGALEGKPIDIDQVTIAHIRYDRTVTQAISKKLAQEQLAEQKAFELEVAKQDAEIARTQARGASDAIRIRAEGEAKAIEIKGKAQAEAQAAITRTLTKSYLQYKAFDGDSTRYYFLPVGKDGLPIIINADGTPPKKRGGMASIH